MKNKDIVRNPDELGNTFDAGAMCVLNLIKENDNK